MAILSVVSGCESDYSPPPIHSAHDACDYFWDIAVIDDRSDEKYFQELADATEGIDAALAREIRTVAAQGAEADDSEMVRVVFQRCTSLGWPPPSETEISELLQERAK